MRPEDALPVINSRGRTPLPLILEGIALVAQFPEVLEKNKCFMLSGVATRPTGGFRRYGSPSKAPSSAACGTATRTRGSAPPRPPSA